MGGLTLGTVDAVHEPVLWVMAAVADIHRDAT